MITAQTILEVITAEPAEEFVKRTLPEGWAGVRLWGKPKDDAPPEVRRERALLAAYAADGIPQGEVYRIDCEHPDAEAVMSLISAVHNDLDPVVRRYEGGVRATDDAWVFFFARLAASLDDGDGQRLDRASADPGLWESAFFGVPEEIAARWLCHGAGVSERLKALAAEDIKVADECKDPHRVMDDFSRSALRRLFAIEAARYAAALHRRLHEGA